jgi:Rho GTPase-activating protein RGD1
MAENRLKFSQRLNEMGDELAVLIKEVEKNRKLVRLGSFF